YKEDDMPRICKKKFIINILCIAALMVLLVSTVPPSGAAACGNDAGEVDVTCFGGNLSTALANALATDRPLLLPAGTYSLNQTLVIDYATRADSGFRIISQGARIDGTAIHNGPVIVITCSGGTTAKPKGCFYFHQEGTLFVNADTADFAV